MAKMKYWNGTTWKILDAKDADTVDGKHFTDIQNDAQEKADEAEQNAKSYTNQQITDIQNDVQEKVGEAEQNAKSYTNQQITLVTTALSDIETNVGNVETEIAAHKAENVTTHNVSRGVSNFAGNGQEVTIPHGLSAKPTSAYAFPTVNPEGYLGEVWIRMDATNLYIGNSGSFTGAMSWTAIG